MSRGEPYRKSPETPQRSNPEKDGRIIRSRGRADQVVAARMRSLSWQKVADEVGISKSQAFKLWKEWLESEPAQRVEDYRELERGQLDRRHRDAERDLARAELALKDIELTGKTLFRFEHWRRVKADARTELDRVATLRAKLNGTFAPTKHQVVGKDDGPIQLAGMSTEHLFAIGAKNKGEDAPAPPRSDGDEDGSDDAAAVEPPEPSPTDGSPEDAAAALFGSETPTDDEGPSE